MDPMGSGKSREPNSLTTQVSMGPSFQKRFGRVQDRFRLFDVQVLFDQKTSEKTVENVENQMCRMYPPKKKD